MSQELSKQYDLPLLHTWQPIEDFSRALWPLVDPVLEATAEKLNFPLSLLGFAQLGLEYYSREFFEHRDALTQFDKIETWLKELTADGWLEAVGGSRYRVTQVTRNSIRAITQAGDTYLGTLDIMPASAMERLVSYLKRVVQASIAMPAPPTKWITMHRFRAINDDTSLLGRIRDYGMDLYAYRDDSHRSAWQEAHQVEGYVWDAFTHIWRGNYTSPEQIAEQTAFRGYTTADYNRAIQRLVSFGWVEAINNQFQATAVGRHVREHVEQRTDVYFYRPWQTELSEDNWREMNDLSLQLLRSLESYPE